MVDVRAGQDVRLLEHPREPVRGILAAPPCTLFSSAGAGTWSRRSEKELLDALAVVDACLRLVAVCQPDWWALENPPGRLERWLGPPDWSFQPFQFGDPWTKRTYLWGSFARPVRAEGEEVEAKGSRLASASKALRSQTPEGFARAFARANP